MNKLTYRCNPDKFKLSSLSIKSIISIISSRYLTVASLPVKFSKIDFNKLPEFHKLTSKIYFLNTLLFNVLESIETTEDNYHVYDRNIQIFENDIKKALVVYVGEDNDLYYVMQLKNKTTFIFKQ